MRVDHGRLPLRARANPACASTCSRCASTRSSRRRSSRWCRRWRRRCFDAGTRGTSVLVTAQGIGAVLMAFALGTLSNRFGIRRVLVTLLALLPPALLAYAFAPALAAVGAHVVRRRRALSRRALELLHDRAAPRAGRPPRPRARGEHRDPRLAVPARRGRAGQDRRPHRAARDHRRRRGADGRDAAGGAARAARHHRAIDPAGPLPAV